MSTTSTRHRLRSHHRAGLLVFAALLGGLLNGSARAQTTHRVQLSLDGQAIGEFPVLIERGLLLLPLDAFASLGWRPLLDPHHGIIDLAHCLRLNMRDRQFYLIGGPASLGVREAGILPPMTGAVKFQNAKHFVPARSVLNQLGFTLDYSKAAQTVAIYTPDLAKLDPTQEACVNGLR